MYVHKKHFVFIYIELCNTKLTFFKARIDHVVSNNHGFGQCRSFVEKQLNNFSVIFFKMRTNCYTYNHRAYLKHAGNFNEKLD